MDISKINSAISQAGYNPFAIGGVGEQDAQKLAEQNNISIEEAKQVLKEAEEKVDKNDKLQQEASAMLEMLNTQDEEEIIIIDDADFDNFLNENSPEQQMQDLLKQNVFANKQNNSNSENNQNKNMFSEDNNPFLKLSWQN